MAETKNKTQTLVSMSVLVALIFVLQTISNFVSIPGLPFKITLTLIPIVVGGILFGPRAGAILGASFGLIVSLFVVTGLDSWSHSNMFVYRPFITLFLCMLKGTLAGFLPALVYKAIPKEKTALPAAFCASLLAPVVNTSVFLACVMLFYRPKFVEWGSDSFANVMLFLIIGFCGFNFLFEFFTSLILSPAVATVVKAVRKEKE